MKHKRTTVLAFLLTGALAISGCTSAVPETPPQESNGVTMISQTAMSRELETPIVYDALQSIALEFSEPIDRKSAYAAIKLYRIDAFGNSVEEPIALIMEPETPARIIIHNEKAVRFSEGEVFKLDISNTLKSATGISLAEGFTGYFAINNGFSFTQAAEDTDSSASERSLIVVISDLHLGIDDDFTETRENRAILVEFLNQIGQKADVKEIVIAGDFLDGWFLPMDFEMPNQLSGFFDQVAANNPAVVEAINGIIKEGKIKVTYIPGNHDMLATKADIERLFPGINQAREQMQGLGAYTTGADAEVIIEHGHRYDFFCAPDPISNRDITKNTTSILPPGYFFTRMATSSIIEGLPATANVVQDMTPNSKDESQYGYFLYHEVWKGLVESMPINEKLTDAVIRTNLDGYTANYAVGDLIPKQDAATGSLDVTLYKGAQDTWNQRQELNGVRYKMPASEAITKSLNKGYLDVQSKNQYFDRDGSKRIVVFGHSHGARLLDFVNVEKKKTIFANSGTWIDDARGYPTRTFVVIHPAKNGSAIQTVNLYQYTKGGIVTQWGEGQGITIIKKK